MRRAAWIAAMVLAPAACGPADHGRLEAASLVVDPCSEGKARAFTPFVLDATLLRWIETGGTAELEMREGYGAATGLDAVVVQFADARAVHAHVKEAPGEPLAVDGDQVRIGVFLGGRCADTTQSIVGRNGTILFSALDTSIGGRIAGTGRFDLHDLRAFERGDTTPLAAGATLEFDLRVRKGILFEDYTH